MCVSLSLSLPLSLSSPSLFHPLQARTRICVCVCLLLSLLLCYLHSTSHFLSFPTPLPFPSLFLFIHIYFPSLSQFFSFFIFPFIFNPLAISFYSQDLKKSEKKKKNRTRMHQGPLKAACTVSRAASVRKPREWVSWPGRECRRPVFESRCDGELSPPVCGLWCTLSSLWASRGRFFVVCVVILQQRKRFI